MEFEVKHIENLCKKITDGSHFSPENDTEGVFPMYSVKDMEYNGFSLNGYKTIGKEVFEKLSKADCRPLQNDILIAKDGSYLKYVFKTKQDLDACILSSIAILRPNVNVIDPDYFVYILRTKSVKGAMANYVSGSALPRIILSDFKKMKVRIAKDQAVQRRIASILSAYDNLIENNNRRIHLLEQMAENLYKEWFVRFRFPGHEKAEFENGLPKGWKTIHIKDITSLKSGYAFKSEWFTDDGCCVAKIKDIGNTIMDTSDFSYVDKGNCLKAKKFILNEGDLTIALTGATIGKISIVPRYTNPIYTNQRLGKFFNGDKPILKLPFLYCLFSQPKMTQMILNFSNSSSAQPNISPEQIESIKFIGDLNLIKEFNIRTWSLYKHILNLYYKNVSLSRQRDLLLPRLMSGKLEVKV